MKNNFKLVLFAIVLLQTIPLFTNAQDSLKKRLEKHVYTLADDSLRGRKAGSEYAKKAALYIESQFREVGIETYNLQFFGPNEKYKNIIGILPGNDPILKEEYIVVGAHYDHIGFRVRNGDTIVYNGADDNASGVATMLELCRNLKEIQPSLKRSIIFIAFDAEEIGLVGSNHFVDFPTVPLEKIKLMFSVDMVGWHEVSGYVKYIGVGGVDKHVEKNIFANKDLIPLGLNVKLKDFETSIFTGTDTEGFFNKGIPAVHVFTGTESPYHKPEDDAHLIDYDGMVLITEHLTNIIRELSIYNEINPSGKMEKKYSSKFKKFNIGVSLNLGSNHHYYTAGPIDGKSSNAFSAGLTSQINFKRFLAIRPEMFYDYTQAKHPGGTISTNNITVPLSLVIQSPIEEMGGFDLFFGGYYNYKLNGKQSGVELDFSNDFYRNEGGVTYGFGVRLNKIKVSYTGRNALTNFTRNKNEDEAHIRNVANYVTLTYIF